MFKELWHFIAPRPFPAVMLGNRWQTSREDLETYLRFNWAMQDVMFGDVFSLCSLIKLITLGLLPRHKSILFIAEVARKVNLSLNLKQIIALMCSYARQKKTNSKHFSGSTTLWLDCNGFLNKIWYLKPCYMLSDDDQLPSQEQSDRLSSGTKDAQLGGHCVTAWLILLQCAAAHESYEPNGMLIPPAQELGAHVCTKNCIEGRKNRLQATESLAWRGKNMQDIQSMLYINTLCW